MNKETTLEQVAMTHAVKQMEAMSAPDEATEPSEPHPMIMDALNKLHDTHGQTQAILMAINKPKRIIRGADGRPEGIE
jgi:hypothetical protein